MKKHVGFIAFLLFSSFFSLKPYCIRITVLSNKKTDQNVVFFHDIHIPTESPQLEKIKNIILALDQSHPQGVNILVEAHEYLGTIEKMCKIEQKLSTVDDQPSHETWVSKQLLPFVSQIQTKNIPICSIDDRGYLAAATSAMRLIIKKYSLKKHSLNNKILEQYSLEKCCQNLEQLNEKIKMMSNKLPETISSLLKKGLIDSEKFVTDVRKKLEKYLTVSFSDFDKKLVDLIKPIISPFFSLLGFLLDYEIVHRVLNTKNNTTTLIFTGAAHCDEVEEMLEKKLGWKKTYDSGILIRNGAMKHEGKTLSLIHNLKREYAFFKHSRPDLTLLNYQIKETRAILIDHLFKKDAKWLKFIQIR